MIDDSRWTKLEHFFVSIIFVIILLLFATLGLSGLTDSLLKKTVIGQENRVFASFPCIRSVRQISSFPSLFESYYKDAFLPKLFLCSVRNFIDYTLLQSSGNSSVAIGRDGFRFYAVNKLPIAQQNENAYEPPELEDAIKAFWARQDFFARHGIKYLVLIAPEKGTIYPELLPRGWKRQSTPGRLEQLQTAFLKEQIECVDARQILLRAKNMRPCRQLYFSNDSHWNSYGAYLVAQQLFTQLHKQFKSITTFEDKR